MAASLGPSGLSGVESIKQVKQYHYTGITSIAGGGVDTLRTTPVVVSITPSSTSSKILVIATMNIDWTRSNAAGGFTLTRNGTQIGNPADPGAGYFVHTGFEYQGNADQSWMHNTIHYLDSPNSTSSLAYRVELKAQSGYTLYINRTQAGSQASQTDDGVATSTITVMEIGQ